MPLSIALIIPLGTQIVLRCEVLDDGSKKSYEPGAVAQIIGCPADAQHSYQVRFPNGQEANVTREQFSLLKHIKAGPLREGFTTDTSSLAHGIIYRCVVGSRAYGLSHESSDTDRRGIYLAPADLDWSLYGVPEQIENRETDECYWELKKFITLAFKANPNILECLFTPLVEESSEIADALLAQRNVFLSKLVYQTYNGYVMSQFKKLEQDLRASGHIRWKHAMHLIRLLLQGINVLQQAHVSVRVDEHRDALLAIRKGNQSWAEVDRWRLALHLEFDLAYRRTRLPDSPDYAAANQLLVWARRRRAEESA